MEKLTAPEQKFLDFYLDKANWRPPTHQVMMEYMEWHSTSMATKYLKRLRSKGYPLP